MKSDKLGYLTTDPKYLGTSMQACMYLRLPKLSRELDEIQQIADKFHLEIGIDIKTHEEYIFIVRNKSCLGHTEKQYIESVYYGAKALIRREL